MKFNTDTRIKDLMENEQAANILHDVLPGISAVIDKNPKAQELSPAQAVRYAGLPQPDAILQKLNTELDALNAQGQVISSHEAELIKAFRQIQKAELSGKPEAVSHHQDSIRPGEVWIDTKGERIQAHGGGVFYEDGMYYWYGENKEYTDGCNGVWTWGIKVYLSRDLMNWTDGGYLIKPDIKNPDSPLFPAKRIDRPHLLKNDRTGKYVIWIKLSGSDASFTIWEADALLGPYTMKKDYYRPLGCKAGDFDLVKDEKTGKAYLFFDKDHETMMGMELSEDYLSAVKEVSKNYSSLNPPFTREAPALFEAAGRKYMFTSGMTGYVPNRSDAAVSDSYEKEFRSLGSPHADDPSNASFNSQISKVFRVHGTDQLIAMADRWLPGYKVDADIADLFTRTIAMHYDPAHYHASDEEVQQMLKANVLETADTGIADYVWLPVEWENGRPVLKWKKEWKPEHQ